MYILETLCNLYSTYVKINCCC
ncbi:MAG: DUF1563 domain-containing protein [Bacteroidota bacterium]